MYITLFWIMLVSVMVACIDAFLLLLAYKVGAVEWLQVHGDDVFSRMAHCDFCMSFWLSFIIMLVVVWQTGDVAFMSVPLFATPIARRML